MPPYPPPVPARGEGVPVAWEDPGESANLPQFGPLSLLPMPIDPERNPNRPSDLTDAPVTAADDEATLPPEGVSPPT